MRNAILRLPCESLGFVVFLSLVFYNFHQHTQGWGCVFAACSGIYLRLLSLTWRRLWDLAFPEPEDPAGPDVGRPRLSS